MSELTTLEKLNKITSKDAKHFILTDYNFWSYTLEVFSDDNGIELCLGEQASSRGYNLDEYVWSASGKTFDECVDEMYTQLFGDD